MTGLNLHWYLAHMQGLFNGDSKIKILSAIKYTQKEEISNKFTREIQRLTAPRRNHIDPGAYFIRAQ